MTHYLPVDHIVRHRRVTPQELSDLECHLPVLMGRIGDYVIEGALQRVHLSSYQYDAKPGPDGLYGISFFLTVLAEVEDSRQLLNPVIG